MKSWWRQHRARVQATRVIARAEKVVLHAYLEHLDKQIDEDNSRSS